MKKRRWYGKPRDYKALYLDAARMVERQRVVMARAGRAPSKPSRVVAEYLRELCMEIRELRDNIAKLDHCFFDANQKLNLRIRGVEKVIGMRAAFVKENVK